MRIAFAINAAEENAIAAAADNARGSTSGLPAVDLGENGFHFQIAELIFRIPPIKGSQRLIERVA